MKFKNNYLNITHNFQVIESCIAHFNINLIISIIVTIRNLMLNNNKNFYLGKIYNEIIR